MAVPAVRTDPGRRMPTWQVWRWELHWQILLGLLLGVALGWLSGRAAVEAAANHPQPTVAAVSALREGIDFRVYSVAGQLFLNGLKLIVVPVVVSSLVLAVAGLGGQAGFGRIGAKALAFFVGTTLLAVILGVGLMNLVGPGRSRDSNGRPLLTQRQPGSLMEEAQLLRERTAGKTQADYLSAVVLDLVPANVVKAAAENSLLGLIMISLAVGYQLSRLTGGPRQVWLDLFTGLNEIALELAKLVMAFSPIGVAGLLAGTLSENYARLTTDGRLGELLGAVGLFFAVVAGGLLLHMFGTLAVLVSALAGGVGVPRFYRTMVPAMVTAFSTSSSAATIPINLACVRRLGVSERLSSFLVSLGATVNMNGTALYECAAALFVAQLYGIELTLHQQVIAVLLALITAVGVPGIPSASLVAIVIMLNTVGVPAEGLAVVLIVDRPLDMSRTVVNIIGDACGAVVIAHSEGELTIDRIEPPDP